MKKKGFTLIELLAVIVILAIIALIATPLVLKYIETSKINSKKASTQNYINAVDNALVTYSITNKGKKYSEGCYEISTLNTELDITMKGDMPSEGKVCIENNKIEKAIVKYSDNKIIKYEDDKSTISDEETYESFNSVSNYIIDADVEFVYDESQGIYVATLTITKEMASKFQSGMLCDFIMDNGQIETMSSIIVDGNGGFVNDTRFFKNAQYFFMRIKENQLMFEDMSGEITGIHNIKIGNLRISDDRIAIAIGSNGSMNIYGYDFIEGDSSILITDEEGTEYYNKTVAFTGHRGDGLIGADWGCRNNIPQLPDVYTAIANHKKVIIQIIQTVDTKEIVHRKEVNISNANISSDDLYYWGVSAFFAAGGC